MKEMNEGNKERLEIVLEKQKDLFNKKIEQIQTREKEITETVVEQWENFFEKYIIPNLEHFNNSEISIETIRIVTKKLSPGCATISFISTFDWKTMLKLDIDDSALMAFICSNSEYTIQDKFKGTKYAPYFEIYPNNYYSGTTCNICPIYK